MNTINFLPMSYEGFSEVQVSVSTFYEIKFKETSAKQPSSIRIDSAYIYQASV